MRLTPVDVGSFIVFDTTPDAFGFESRSDVAAGESLTSNTITPSGYDTPAVITVINGEYSIGCSGSFTASTGAIAPGQSVCVRHTASTAPATTVTTTLTIGGVSGTFSSTTAIVEAAATAVATGTSHTCALTSNGGVKCWGGNCTGQLGDGTMTQREVPTEVAGLPSGAVAIGAGGSHTCAALAGGGVKCWGLNLFGQAGDGTTVPRRLLPVSVVGLSGNVSAIAGGYAHTCALTTDGGIKCWGNNNGGALGDGTETDRLTPVDVQGLPSAAIAVTAGWGHSCALVGEGAAKCWG
jgi:predicted thioesterase